VSGTQGWTTGVAQTPGAPPPPQSCPTGQVPQLSGSPHPSPAGPQLKPCDAQVAGMQPSFPPQTPGVPPPPQLSGFLQRPHSMRCPQPSPAGPQLMPSDAHVAALQTGATD
jgi:hypothetical protein